MQTKEHETKTPRTVSVFKFPSDNITKLRWINAIPRTNLQVTSSTDVCGTHFAETFIERTLTKASADGTVVTTPRKRPKLTADAYPSLFLNTLEFS